MRAQAFVTREDALPLETVVDRYELVSERGRGGMGVVYKARDLKLDRFVALKFLPSEWSQDESARNRFRREARAGSATYHRNVCTVHDIDSTDDGQLFIVMADYDGETLKEKLENGPLGVAEALDIAAQIADGLSRLHASGVVHRDIKPSNLMVTDGVVKILDFGVARLAGEQQLTLPGSLTPGTIAYMAPEQAKGEDADERSDVWALGVVLYEMLAGHVPFRGAYPEAILYAIRHERVPALRNGRGLIPAAVQKLVRKALDKNANNRFQSAREFGDELRRLADADDGGTRKEASVSHERSADFPLPVDQDDRDRRNGRGLRGRGPETATARCDQAAVERSRH
jgi:eukaryotic-like serine/threonine-protein kinase